MYPALILYIFSVLSSCVCQLSDNIHITTLECIKSYIFIELTDNIQYYLPFFQTFDNQCIFKGLNDYLIHKIYNQEFGDLVPALIANALNTRLVVFNEDRVKASVDILNITPEVIRQSTSCCIDAVSTTMVFNGHRLRRRQHHRLRR